MLTSLAMTPKGLLRPHHCWRLRVTGVSIYSDQLMTRLNHSGSMGEPAGCWEVMHF